MKMRMYKGNHVAFVLVYFVLFFLELRIWAGPEDPSVCPLNLTAYPYLPAGECSGNFQEELDDWDSFPTTRCCLNGLTAFTQSLAIHALANDSIFLTKNQWGKCDGSFSRQQSVSIKNCSFDALYYDQSPCQNLSLSTLKSTYPKQVQFVLGNCSSFNSSYDSTCEGCTRAIQDARDVLLKQVKENEQNQTLKGICSVVVVIAAVSQHINDPQWVGDFYRCLPGSALEDAGFLKIKSSVAKALLVVMVAIMLLLLVVVLIKYVAKKKNIKPVEGKEISAWSGLYRFSRSEIESAINFKSRKVSLGAGSAGRVYKGILPSGQVVGIKHIYKSNTSDSFTREVEGLSRIRHPNLVCLFGCCVDNGEQYLVYEYCSNGNLAQHLLKRDSSLTWAKRVKILRDCANALRFLHAYPDGCIVHRDIKLTNILLTENMEPKLSDFGLAKMLGMEESKVFTDVRGTIGYMDPEYMSNAKLTCASDIYSFGIVMLQLLSGRKVIELDLDARDQLTRKAKDVIMGKRPISDFEDPRLKGELNAEDFESILHVAVLCVAKSSKGRPTIDVVLQELEKVWQNTKSYKKSKGGKSSSDTPSRSLEVMEV